MNVSLCGGRALVAALVVLVAGCSTRSISNSGYNQNHRGTAQMGGYTGELSELEVIGVTADTAITEADIQDAVRGPAGAVLSRNSNVLLIQSGAEYPDASMLEAMRGRFTVAAFSGKPQSRADRTAAFSKTLRLVAARGGYDKIVCYWGVLESAHEDKVTRTVSWVPIVGFVIPDQREHMRISLKAVIVDVATGRWTFVTSPSAASSKLSTALWREETDQQLVHKLKAEGYQRFVQTLAEHHTS